MVKDCKDHLIFIKNNYDDNSKNKYFIQEKI